MTIQKTDERPPREVWNEKINSAAWKYCEPHFVCENLFQFAAYHGFPHHSSYQAVKAEFKKRGFITNGRRLSGLCWRAYNTPTKTLPLELPSFPKGGSTGGEIA